MSRVWCVLLAAILVSSPASARSPVPVVNTRLSLGYDYVLHQHRVFYTVRESDLLVDLNGDDDVVDIVLHVLDLQSGVTTNLGLAGGWVDYNKPFRDNFAAFVVSEPGQGRTDLNGDGDVDDVVLHLYDAETNGTTNLGLAAGAFTFVGPELAFQVSEVSQGETDLNGDGDALDYVLHLLNVDSGAVTNVGIAGFLDEPFQDRFLSSWSTSHTRAGKISTATGIRTIWFSTSSTSTRRRPRVSSSPPFYFCLPFSMCILALWCRRRVRVSPI